MIRLFQLMFLHEVRKDHSSLRLAVFWVISTFSMVWVYYMTGQSIEVKSDSALEWYGFDYFHFLITGEIALLLPEVAMGAHSRVIRLAMHSKVNWEIMRKPWKSGLKLYTLFSGAVINVAFLDLILFVFCASVFQNQIVLPNFLWGVLYILLSLPCFLILGIAIGSFVMATGRGQGIVNQLMFFLQVLAGVYFPVEIFGNFGRVLKTLLPHSYLVSGAREIFSGTANEGVWLNLLVYQILFALIFLPISLGLYYWAQKRIREKSIPTLIYQ